MLQNNFDDYIKKYIEGYLFNDLNTIKSIDPEANNHSGNLAYLLTISIFSAMEFLGVLLQIRSPINSDGRVDASTGLAHYIKHYLSNIESKYEALVEIAPRLVRNGIVHAYSPKGPVAITRVGARERSHLIRYSIAGILVINANFLYEDFIKSYEDVVKPKIQPNGDMYALASEHYELIRNVYKVEVNTAFESSTDILNRYIPWENKQLPAREGDVLIQGIEATGEPILIS